jgi:GT2 family glycosyltransferase
MNISIVVPTYKRKKSLERLMRSLAVLKGFELIIVEQKENNGAFFKKIAAKLHIRFKYIFLPEPSTPRAMNSGVALAKGKYILFLDDDVVAHKGLLDAHIQSLSGDTVAATVGRSLTRGQKIEAYRTGTGRVTWLGEFKDGFSSTIRQEVDTVIGCNTCWKKDVYKKIGGMDEQFTGNALRLESDLSLRAKKEKYIIIFEPSAVVDHLRAESGGARKTEGRLLWYKDLFSNEVYFFLKHRPVYLLPVFLLTRISWALRCMFGFGREVSVNSFMTPFVGIYNGISKYRIYLHAYENRR